MEKQRMGIISAVISVIILTVAYLFIQYGTINFSYLQYGYGYFCLYLFIVTGYLIYSVFNLDKKQIHDYKKGRNLFTNSNLLKIVLLVVIGLILLAGSNSTVNPEDVVNGTINMGDNIGKINHFEKEGVSFNYSNNWTEVDEDDYVAVLSHNENGAVFQLQVEDQISGMSLDQCVNSIIKDSGKVNSKVLSSKHTKIDNEDAEDIRLNIKVGNSDQEARIICFVKNGKLYSLVFNSIHMDSLNKEIDTIISSFKVS